MAEKELLITIEDVRKKLNKLTRYRTCNDPGVIDIGKEMDKRALAFISI